MATYSGGEPRSVLEHRGTPLQVAVDAQDNNAAAEKPAPANNKNNVIIYILLAAAVIVSLLSLVFNILIMIQLNRGTSEMKSSSHKLKGDAAGELLSEIGKMKEICQERRDETFSKIEKIAAETRAIKSVNEEILDTADNIETNVEAVANATQESDERRDAKMELILGETQEISKKVSNPCPSDGMIGNNGVCYFALFDQTRDTRDAERACENVDSRLADVDSKMTYEQLVIHLLPQVEERGWSTQFFTLGMAFAPDNGTAYFRNGTESAFTPWATGWYNSLPWTSSTYTQLYLLIQAGESVTSNENGFVNYPPSYADRTLCERDVNQ